MSTTVTTQETQGPETLSQKQRDVFKKLGISLLVFGSTSLVLGITNLIMAISYWDFYEYVAYIGAGIWTGILIIVPGGIAIGTAKNPSKCLFVAGTVMTIFAALSCIAQTVIEVFGFMDSYWYLNWDDHYLQAPTVFVAVSHGILAVVGFAALVTTITNSVYCCKYSCCVPQRTVHTVVVYTTAPIPQSGHTNPVMIQTTEHSLPPYSAVMQHKGLQEEASQGSSSIPMKFDANA